jgi:hypothetical protein
MTGNALSAWKTTIMTIRLSLPYLAVMFSANPVSAILSTAPRTQPAFSRWPLRKMSDATVPGKLDEGAGRTLEVARSGQAGPSHEKKHRTRFVVGLGLGELAHHGSELWDFMRRLWCGLYRLWKRRESWRAMEVLKRWCIALAEDGFHCGTRLHGYRFARSLFGRTDLNYIARFAHISKRICIPQQEMTEYKEGELRVGTFRADLASHSVALHLLE